MILEKLANKTIHAIHSSRRIARLPSFKVSPMAGHTFHLTLLTNGSKRQGASTNKWREMS